MLFTIFSRILSGLIILTLKMMNYFRQLVLHLTCTRFCYWLKHPVLNRPNNYSMKELERFSKKRSASAKQCKIQHNGSIHISTNLITTSNSQELLEIKISDSGKGMTQDVLQNAFTHYFSTKQSHTGLGLPIAQEIFQTLHLYKLLAPKRYS